MSLTSKNITAIFDVFLFGTSMLLHRSANRTDKNTPICLPRGCPGGEKDALQAIVCVGVIFSRRPRLVGFVFLITSRPRSCRHRRGLLCLPPSTPSKRASLSFPCFLLVELISAFLLSSVHLEIHASFQSRIRCESPLCRRLSRSFVTQVLPLLFSELSLFDSDGRRNCLWQNRCCFMSFCCCCRSLSR